MKPPEFSPSVIVQSPAPLREETFQHLQHPRKIAGQRAAALRFGDANTQALLMFVFVARGFANQDLRQAMAPIIPIASANSRASMRHFHAAEAAVHSWCDNVHLIS